MDSTLTVFTTAKNESVFTTAKNEFYPNCIYYSKEWILP